MERTVLKIFGSLGPAGSFITLTEKLIRVCFFEAYNLGDPAHKSSLKASENTVKVRENFVHALFEKRGEIERNL